MYSFSQGLPGNRKRVWRQKNPPRRGFYNGHLQQVLQLDNIRRRRTLGSVDNVKLFQTFPYFTNLFTALLRERFSFRKGSFDKTVDDNPMGPAELTDFIRLKTAGNINLSEITIIKQIQDMAYMAGIAGVIQCLNPPHRNSGRNHCGPVNQGPVLVAFAQRIELAAAERPVFINLAGAMIVLKRTRRFSSFFLGQLIGGDPALEGGAFMIRHGLKVFQNNQAFQGGDIHISHGDAAKRTTQAAYRVTPVLPDLIFETSVNCLKFSSLFDEIHGREDTKTVMKIKPLLLFLYRR